MTLGGERGSVQNPFIGYAEAVGWKYVPPDQIEAQRGGATGLFL